MVSSSHKLIEEGSLGEAASRLYQLVEKGDLSEIQRFLAWLQQPAVHRCQVQGCALCSTSGMHPFTLYRKLCASQCAIFSPQLLCMQTPMGSSLHGQVLFALAIGRLRSTLCAHNYWSMVAFTSNAKSHQDTEAGSCCAGGHRSWCTAAWPRPCAPSADHLACFLTPRGPRALMKSPAPASCQ